jgi:transcription antitermination factor NusG
MTKKFTIYDALDIVKTLDDTDFKVFTELFRGEIKDRQDRKGRIAKVALKVGDRVNVVGGKRVKDEKGTIKKINRTRAIVDIDGRGSWNIPFSFITKI